MVSNNLMKILIVAPFCSLCGEPYFNRFLYLAEKFAKQDCKVTLLTSRFQHFQKKRRSDETRRSTELQLGIEVVLLEESGYNSNVGLARVLSHRAFNKNFKSWFENNKKNFDVVYSAYPLIGTNLHLSDSNFDGLYVLDIQDVWPESIVSVYPVARFIPKMLLPFSSMADKVYKSADYIFSVSQTYLSRAMGVRKDGRGEVAYIGADFRLINKSQRDIAFNSLDDLSLFYIGSLSHSYDVETVIKAVILARKEGVRVSLHIFGAGPDEERLRRLSFSGIFFRGVYSYEALMKEVKQCDVAVNCIHSNASQSVTNKISDYLAIGCPIFNSQKNSEVLDLMADRDVFHYESGNVMSCYKALRLMIDNFDFEKAWLPDARMDRDVIYARIVDKVKFIFFSTRD